MNHLRNKTITLCGSTKFKEEFEFMIGVLVRKGWFVHSVEVFGHSLEMGISKEFNDWCDDWHLLKINRSIAIFVIDVEGYIGESTKAEIKHAKIMNKKIYYLSEHDPPTPPKY